MKILRCIGTMFRKCKNRRKNMDESRSCMPDEKEPKYSEKGWNMNARLQYTRESIREIWLMCMEPFM